VHSENSLSLVLKGGYRSASGQPRSDCGKRRGAAFAQEGAQNRFRRSINLMP